MTSIVIMILVIGIVLLLLFRGSNDFGSGGIKSFSGSDKNCRNIEVPYDATERYQESVPYTDRVCDTKKLVYSINNFVMNSNVCNKQEYVCKDTFIGICTEKIYYCVDKSVSCSFSLRNIDNEQGG